MEHLCSFETTVLAPKINKYALIIPVLNEGDRFLAQLTRIQSISPSVDVIVADGNSRDGSTNPTKLERLGVTTLLTIKKSRGVSDQLRVAYSWAIDSGYCGFVTIDGNGKDGVQAIDDFVSALDSGYDYVQGSRYLRGGKAENTPLHRLIGTRLIHSPLISLGARRRFSDTTNGFRAYSKQLLIDDRVRPFRCQFKKYELLFYLTVRAARLGFKIKELPVERIYPPHGPIPTKIRGFSSYIQLLYQTLAVVIGLFNPKD